MLQMINPFMYVRHHKNTRNKSVNGSLFRVWLKQNPTLPGRNPFTCAGQFFSSMPNRVLRDWTFSRSVDMLSAHAEVLFTRLIMKADDYGSYHADPKILSAMIFPLRNIPDMKVESWLKECVDAGLVIRYNHKGKLYLRINNFGQRLRLMKPKFPTPEESTIYGGPLSDDSNPRSDDGQMTVRCQTDDGLKQKLETETEVETESETETETPAVAASVWPTFIDFWNAYGKPINRKQCERKWKSINQGVREKLMDHVPRYVHATPDVQYRKNPLTYLNTEAWNDEIIFSNGNTAKPKRETPTDLAIEFAKRISKSTSGKGLPNDQ